MTGDGGHRLLDIDAREFVVVVTLDLELPRATYPCPMAALGLAHLYDIYPPDLFEALSVPEFTEYLRWQQPSPAAG